MTPSYSPSISPVPFPLWGVNMRGLMTQTEWRRERAGLLTTRGQRCETCGKEEELSRRLYAHEEWEYDTSADPAIARLLGLKLSCWHCHGCEHFGSVKGMVGSGQLSQRAIDDTIAHFCRLNGVDEAAFHAHHEEAFATWAELSRLRWRMDWGPYAEWVKETFEGDPCDLAWWGRQALPIIPAPKPPKPPKPRPVETPEQRAARLAKQRDYGRRYREELKERRKRDAERAARKREYQRQYRAKMKAERSATPEKTEPV